jgi:diguanylate cyclase (GGDEF)-like protein/PAS domain S-box-containing protein
MNVPVQSPPTDANEEVAALIAVLHETGQRLEELTAGEVDAVADREGRTFLLRHAQEHLRQREAAKQAAMLNELRVLFDLMPAMIWFKDTANNIVRINQRAADPLGKPVAELEGKSMLDVYPLEAAKYYADDLEVIRSGMPKLDIVETLRDAAGKETWIKTDKVPVSDNDGKVIGIVVMAQDITLRKEADARIAYLNRVYALLSGINSLIVRVRDRDELFRESCRLAVEAGAFRMARIGMVDRSTMTLVPVASAGMDEATRTLIKDRFSLSEGAPMGNKLTARAKREKRAIVSNDLQNDPDVIFRAEYAAAGIRSLAILPLVVAGEAVGVLALYAGEIEFFHADEIKLLTDLANDIAFAIDHIAKDDKIRRLSRIQSVMSGINAVIVRARDRQTLSDEACRVAVEDGKFGSAWIGELDSVTLKVTAVAWAGASLFPGTGTTRTDVPEGPGVVARSIRTRQPEFDNDILAPSAVKSKRRALAIQAGFRSLVALPFIVDGIMAGHLSLYAKEAGFFSNEEMTLLGGLAKDISFALANIKRQEKFEKLARIRAVSSEINATIVRIHDREALLRETCRIAVEHGGFEVVWTGVIDQPHQHVEPVAWAGIPSEIAQAVSWSTFGKPGSTMGEAIRTRKVAVHENFNSGTAGSAMRQAAIKRGYLSGVCVPFVVDDSVVAAIVLYAMTRDFFDGEELALLNELAADVSFALDAIEKQKQLEYLSYYDKLTGLANRSLFIERLGMHVRSAASGRHKLAVFLIDLERFRNINDSLGLPAGDAFLKQVAEWLTRTAGDASLVARLGADHFAAVLPMVTQDGDVTRLLEQTMEALQAHPFRLGDAVFRISAKAGVAQFPEDGGDAENLFKNAEAALKNAKASGNRYRFYTKTMNEATAGKVTLENQLRQALEKEEFVLHYQPKINLATGKLTAAEALIRWNDPRTGLVPPGRFIPILEETGLIYDVGRWALRKSIEEYLRWRAAGLGAVRIAVNVSPLQLRHRGFLAEIEQVVGIDGHAASGLELEITESVIMEDAKHNIASLTAIRAMGVTVAIDDFGTGFSSLSYLSKLPVDTLKIDRSFVIDMTAGPEGLALVSTIINLAHSLKLKVVAEGVETEEQSRLLRLLSCDEMQGFLFSKPVPAEIFESKFLVPAAGKPA